MSDISTVTKNSSIIKKKKGFSYVIAAELSPYPGSRALAPFSPSTLP